LTANVGSSSVKLDLFRIGARRDVARIGSNVLTGADADPAQSLGDFTDAHRVDPDHIVAIAHRIVHGGEVLTKPVRLTESLDARLGDLVSLAPLHNPTAFRWLRCARDMFTGSAQVLVPDTGFFADLPEVARRYALPASLVDRYRIRRYGFHGLAHEAMWRHWRGAAKVGEDARVITIQLGAGCSMAAIKDGAPVDTSMGFTPLEGLVMATRSGDTDPGLVTWLQERASLTATEMDEMLNRRSGLLGMSGVSADMSVLLADDSPGARLAIDTYVYRARKYLGAYMAVLGGVDGVLFGGGVGQHAPPIRERLLENMDWCGVRLDTARNSRVTAGGGIISTASSRVAVHVVSLDEAVLLAGYAVRLAMGAAGSG
jgi:acetate kinase